MNEYEEVDVSKTTDEDTDGTWPLDCLQRAFVDGAKWWQFHKNGSTMFPSERVETEKQAIGRYGEEPLKAGK